MATFQFKKLAQIGEGPNYCFGDTKIQLFTSLLMQGTHGAVTMP